MVYIETASTDPAVNLAFEEHYLRNKPLGTDILMLWRNQPAVVIGHYQSVFAEANLAYTQTQGIQVLRRISGGGAVYHDLGNLCFSLIIDKKTTGLPNVAHLLQPLVQVLARLGLSVDVTARNDLTLGGKKFSGHAMMVQRDRFLLHGTLLFSADLAALEHALDLPFQQIETKAIPSVRSRVTNLSLHLPAVPTIEAFKQTLKNGLLAGDAQAEYRPTLADLAAIEGLRAGKYKHWAWTFGSDPRTCIRYPCQYADAPLEIALDLEKGYVQSCHLTTHAAPRIEWQAAVQQLAHIRCDRDSVRAALQGTGFGEFLFGTLGPLLPPAPTDGYDTKAVLSPLGGAINAGG